MTVSSPFYSELEELYAQRARAWAAKQYGPDEAENDEAGDEEEGVEE